ncbi:flavodoxin [Acutalibacter caecimuris]|uniref:flavodoxin n=1 Tax=Acutalibacter caecimuris TaxID=3093657 RepID=UPI002AC96A40|nr:flavodoxin [Acutalibacter sp. M00118]
MAQKIVFLLLSVLLLLTGSACAVEGESTVSSAVVPPGQDSSKILVAYFSATGTTRPLAEYAAEHLGADIYEITPQEPYTEEDLAYYTDCRADREQNDPSARPTIFGSVEDMGQYDVVFFGYPIWHGQAPRIISTFLENYDFAGKTIVPFCTSHSSGIGSSADNLYDLAASAEWLEGSGLAPAPAEMR